MKGSGDSAHDEAALEVWLTRIRKLAASASSHASEARGCYVRSKREFDPIDRADVVANVSIAESLAALTNLVLLVVEEGAK